MSRCSGSRRAAILGAWRAAVRWWALVAVALLVLAILAATIIHGNYRKAQQARVSPPTQRDLAGEIAALRQLAVSGEWTRLAEALDRSVVPVPAGEFVMGSDTDREDERPQRRVYLDAFEIDRYEVTNAQYRRYLEATGRPSPPYWSGQEYPSGQADYPVVGVSWPDADAYCKWAGKRLPTEAEWERACRGTDARIYPWGNTWDARSANVDISSHPGERTGGERQPWKDAWALLRATPISPGAPPSEEDVPRLQPVGSYPEGATSDGLLDVAGNASEWAADWYNWKGYQDVPDRNPLVTGPPWNRCLRGSAWYDPYGAMGWAQNMSRCSARNSSHETQDPRVGFRCARSAQ